MKMLVKVRREEKMKKVIVMIVMITTMIVKVKLDEYNGTEMVNEEESRREPTFVFWWRASSYFQPVYKPLSISNEN